MTTERLEMNTLASEQGFGCAMSIALATLSIRLRY